jgi:hypothetical protein
MPVQPPRFVIHNISLSFDCLERFELTCQVCVSGKTEARVSHGNVYVAVELVNEFEISY